MNKNMNIRNILLYNPSIVATLGRELYATTAKTIRQKDDNITEQDCIDYMIQLVIDRTFDGYQTEIQTIYGQLQNILGLKVEPAPDKWDRLYNVDFYIKIGEKYIGLQIKPVNSGIQLPEIYKEYALQAKTHKKFTKAFGGKIFYLFSAKIGDRREIQNKEVIDEIKNEIERLSK